MFAKLWEEGGEYLGYDFIKMVKNDNIGITEGWLNLDQVSVT